VGDSSKAAIGRRFISTTSTVFRGFVQAAAWTHVRLRRGHLCDGMQVIKQ
jgi:hypothetical protein